MGAVAVFDFAAWSARYPEFSTVSSAQATAFFNEATVYHRNDGGGPVADANKQAVMLNALTAHIAMLAVGIGAVQAPAAMVGRISSATQGSISVSADAAALPGTAAWFSQTVYGLNYWQMTASYRTMRYRAPAPRYFGGGFGRR